jgi:hypothetical protein
MDFGDGILSYEKKYFQVKNGKKKTSSRNVFAYSLFVLQDSTLEGHNVSNRPSGTYPELS